MKTAILLVRLYAACLNFTLAGTNHGGVVSATVCETTEAALNSLVSMDRDARRNAAVELDEKRREMVQKLIAIINSTNSAKVKVHAVIVLGEYRAPEAVPVLVQHLEWDDAARGGFYNGLIREEEIEEKCCPVSMALEKIGMPAIPALLDRIVGTDDAKIIEKCVSICRTIEGREVTQFRLQGLLAKETDPKKKARIVSALEALEKKKAGK